MTRTKPYQLKRAKPSNLPPMIDRRGASRHQTTIVIKSGETQEPITVRGDINKDGFFFVPELDLAEGEELALEVRLPGLGEWAECNGVVSAVTVRGNTQGVILFIYKVTGDSLNAVVQWRRLLKKRSQRTMNQVGSSNQRAS